MREGRHRQGCRPAEVGYLPEEKDDVIKRQQVIVDPDNGHEAVLRGLRSIKRGAFIELRTEEDLRRFFDDIILRGKKRLAAKRKSECG